MSKNASVRELLEGISNAVYRMLIETVCVAGYAIRLREVQLGAGYRPGAGNNAWL